MIELPLPPTLVGSDSDKLMQLHSYLFQLINKLQWGLYTSEKETKDKQDSLDNAIAQAKKDITSINIKIANLHT